MNSNMQTEKTQFHDNPRSMLRRKQLNVVRVLSLFAFYSFANYLPGPPMPLGGVSMWIRRSLAKRFFLRMGRDVKVHKRVHLGAGQGIQIGDCSSINVGCRIACDTIIGNDVMLGPEVTILSSSHEFTRTDISMRAQGETARRPVVIGSDVWIGTRAILLPGVTIGDHSIVGAGAIVTKNVDPWSIVAGNPARLIRYRNVPQ